MNVDKKKNKIQPTNTHTHTHIQLNYYLRHLTNKINNRLKKIQSNSERFFHRFYFKLSKYSIADVLDAKPEERCKYFPTKQAESIQ